MRKAVFAALCAMFGASGGIAEEASELRTLVTANDSRGWEAVGRLDVGRDGFCTGALIEPDVVLTAAHCLFDPASQARVPDGEIEFLAGWRNGRATAYRAVRASVVHPEYTYNGQENAGNVAQDIALLQLARPIKNGSVTPYQTDKRPRKGDEVGVVSYARDRATRPSIQEVCHVLGRPAGTLVLSCNVDFGSSGAPVFSFEGGVPRIVSVISAKAQIAGRPVSLGTRLDGELLDLQAALNSGGDPDPAPEVVAAPVVRKIGTAGSKTSGAKFVRP